MDIIEAHNIHRRFGKGTLESHVLKGLSVSVKQGEFLGIMGKSGAGKSTFMYQLSLLDEPNEGSIRIDGVDVLSLTEKEKTDFRLRTLGYIFQDYALVPDLSAQENVMIPILMRGGSWNSSALIAQQSLDEVGLKNKYGNLPAELSGGEQQRVAIARALAGKPKILFADEPTANLDSASSEQVIGLLTQLNREINQTIIMVTHEYEYTQHCNRVIYLEDGQIVREEERH